MSCSLIEPWGCIQWSQVKPSACKLYHCGATLWVVVTTDDQFLTRLCITGTQCGPNLQSSNLAVLSRLPKLDHCKLQVLSFDSLVCSYWYFRELHIYTCTYTPARIHLQDSSGVYTFKMHIDNSGVVHTMWLANTMFTSVSFNIPASVYVMVCSICFTYIRDVNVWPFFFGLPTYTGCCVHPLLQHLYIWWLCAIRLSLYLKMYINKIIHGHNHHLTCMADFSYIEWLGVDS